MLDGRRGSTGAEAGHTPVSHTTHAVLTASGSSAGASGQADDAAQSAARGGSRSEGWGGGKSNHVTEPAYQRRLQDMSRRGPRKCCLQGEKWRMGGGNLYFLLHEPLGDIFLP